MEPNYITINTTIEASIERVWNFWTNPEHITNWNFASDDWHSPNAVNDLKTGGKFCYRMEAKDSSVGFDFEGVYNKIIENKLIEYTLLDGRKVTVEFSQSNGITLISEKFEPETENPIDMQKAGWQAILDNFRKYTQSN